ncbi:hypothetical protein KCU59_g48, partial [Aureobasidium melanogenum]
MPLSTNDHYLAVLIRQAKILIFEDQRPHPSVWDINYFTALSFSNGCASCMAAIAIPSSFANNQHRILV